MAHEKIYLFDAGVFRSLRPRGPLDRPEEMDGQALEGLVAQPLRAWAAYSRQAVELFYWRSRAGTEVDFVVWSRWATALTMASQHRRQPFVACAPIRFATNQYVRLAIHAAATAATNPIMPMNSGPPSVRNETGTTRSRCAS